MNEGDAAFEALRRAVEELAGGEAQALVADARAEARAKVRSILAEAIAQALLERSSAVLAAEADPAAPASAGVGPAPVASESPDATSFESPDAGSEGPPPSNHGWYVYCVARAPLEIPDGLTGVDQREPVSVLADGGLAAVTSRVSLAEFGEQTLRENLGDARWLEDKARGHERVLEAALGLATVIPMRLCTIYGSEAAVRAMLAREHHSFVEALERLGGRTEWGVKVFADLAQVERAAEQRSGKLAELAAELDELSEGEAYMRRKGLDTVRREEAERLVEACTDGVHSRLTGLAVEALVNPPQRREVSGRSGEMVLNGVYLVDDAAVEQLHTAVEELAAEYGPLGFELEPTGPWPPYNFVKTSLEAAL
jgi:Gas vesicle synthesis protein GvpL/GvpF